MRRLPLPLVLLALLFSAAAGASAAAFSSWARTAPESPGARRRSGSSACRRHSPACLPSTNRPAKGNNSDNANSCGLRSPRRLLLAAGNDRDARGTAASAVNDIKSRAASSLTRMIEAPETIPHVEAAGAATTSASARRRSVVVRAAAMAALWIGCGRVANARAEGDYNKKSSSSTKDVYRDTEQRFEFEPPRGFQQTAKPLPTHLKEVQFAPAEIDDDHVDDSATAAPPRLPKSYQYGITVDPVRIASLRDFGTPQEVAAKVVAAELNRDGVFVVTLMKDPVEEDYGGNNLAYVLNYKSQGKRGDKRFVCKFYIAQNRLYALTAQCREDDYSKFQNDMDAAVSSFRLLPET